MIWRLEIVVKSHFSFPSLWMLTTFYCYWRSIMFTKAGRRFSLSPSRLNCSLLLCERLRNITRSLWLFDEISFSKFVLDEFQFQSRLFSHFRTMKNSGFVMKKKSNAIGWGFNDENVVFLLNFCHCWHEFESIQKSPSSLTTFAHDISPCPTSIYHSHNASIKHWKRWMES